MPKLTPPYEMTGTYGDGVVRHQRSDLLNYFTYPEGRAIVKRNGAWELTPVADPDTDTEIFLGGYGGHTITDAKAAELTAAGFGAYISPDESTPVPTDPDGFGEGGFGEGGFGD